MLQQAVSFFRTLFFSFFSREVYRSAISDWKGLGFGYLSACVFVTQLVCTMACMFYLNQALIKIQPTLDRLPNLTVKNGEVQMDKPSPYEIPLYPASKQQPAPPSIIFDFRPGITTIEGERYGLLLTSRAFSYVDPRHRHFDVPITYADGSMGPQDFKSFPALMRLVGFPLLMAVQGPLSLTICVVQVLLLAGVGKLITSVGKSKLTFVQILRTTVVALGPVLVMNALWLVLPSAASALSFCAVQFLVLGGFIKLMALIFKMRMDSSIFRNAIMMCAGPVLVLDMLWFIIGLAWMTYYMTWFKGWILMLAMFSYFLYGISSAPRPAFCASRELGETCLGR